MDASHCAARVDSPAATWQHYTLKNYVCKLDAAGTAGNAADVPHAGFIKKPACCQELAPAPALGIKLRADAAEVPT
jgi:hypothetical protein